MAEKKADVFGTFLRETGRLAALQQPGQSDLPLPTEGQTNALALSGVQPAAHTFDGSGRLTSRSVGGVITTLDWTDPLRPIITNNKGAAPVRLVLDAQGRYLSREAVAAPAPSPSPGPSPSPAPALWWQSQASGTWAAVPASNMLAAINPANNPAINPNHPGAPEWGSAFASIVGAWNGAYLDPATGKLYIGLAGGHNDYGGNEMLVTDLSAAAPAWSIVRNPSGAVGNLLTTNDLQEASGVYADGQSRTPHTYNGCAYVPGVGPVQVAIGASVWNRANAGKTWSVFIDPATGLHHFTPEAPASLQAYQADGRGVCFDPSRGARGSLWYCTRGNSPMMRYTLPDTGNAWGGVHAEVGPIEAKIGLNALAYIPGADCIIVGSCQDDRSGVQWRVFDCAAGTWHTPTVTGALVGGCVPGAAGLEWVPSLGAACLWDNDTQPGIINRVTPGANPRLALNIDQLSFTGATVPTVRTLRGTFGRFRYVPNLGGFVLLNAVDQQPYFYKL